DEDVDVIGLSILSGSHRELVPEVLRQLEAEHVHAPVIVGGIIPDADHKALLDAGVARIYTPKDYRVGEIMSDIADVVLDDKPHTGA
ncbi:MAG TPA: cobalamin-dependent protein, partial [Acidimicrobiia bacterium]